MKLKKTVFEMYGGKCTCCGEVEQTFLCLDHVRDDGQEDRAKKGGTCYGSYREAKKEFRPDKYQLLCWNCNHGKRVGGCPHKR